MTIAHQMRFWAKSCKGQVGQTGVLGGPDAVLAAGAAAVAQLEVGDLGVRSAGAGVGGERGDPVAVVVGDPKLRARVRALDSGDHPHPGRPGREVEQPGSATYAPSRTWPSAPSAGQGVGKVAVSGR